MGSYNHIGNFSKLPITYGDRIVILIGVKAVSSNHDINAMTPGMGFSPIFVPIRGSYDDYGGIEKVDKTDSIKLLEEHLGKTAEEIVSIAERNESNCGDQVKQETNDIFNKMTLYDIDKENSYFGYVMEHESIFDKLVSISNLSIKDTYFNNIPSEFLQKLGYVSEVIGKDDKENNIIIWKHPNYPTIKQCFYTWLESEFGNYSHTIHYISKLCKKIGCQNIPTLFDKSFLEHVFLTDIQNVAEYQKEKQKRLKEVDNVDSDEMKTLIRMTLRTINKFAVGKYHFTFQHHFIDYGLFSWGGQNVNINYMCNIFDIANNEHLQEKFMKDFVDLAAFIMTLRDLNIPWGTSPYGGQDINYKSYVDLYKTYYDFINDKYQKYESDCFNEND